MALFGIKFCRSYPNEGKYKVSNPVFAKCDRKVQIIKYVNNLIEERRGRFHVTVSFELL